MAARPHHEKVAWRVRILRFPSFSARESPIVHSRRALSLSGSVSIRLMTVSRLLLEYHPFASRVQITRASPSLALSSTLSCLLTRHNLYRTKNKPYNLSFTPRGTSVTNCTRPTSSTASQSASNEVVILWLTRQTWTLF